MNLEELRLELEKIEEHAYDVFGEIKELKHKINRERLSDSKE